MRLFGKVDGLINEYDGAAWLWPPFVLSTTVSLEILDVEASQVYCGATIAGQVYRGGMDAGQAYQGAADMAQVENG